MALAAQAPAVNTSQAAAPLVLVSVTLSFSTAFFASETFTFGVLVQQAYIAQIASLAGVSVGNVNITSVTLVPSRRLAASSYVVATSVTMTSSLPASAGAADVTAAATALTAQSSAAGQSVVSVLNAPGNAVAAQLTLVSGAAISSTATGLSVRDPVVSGAAAPSASPSAAPVTPGSTDTAAAAPFPVAAVAGACGAVALLAIGAAVRNALSVPSSKVASSVATIRTPAASSEAALPPLGHLGTMEEAVGHPSQERAGSH